MHKDRYLQWSVVSFFRLLGRPLFWIVYLAFFVFLHSFKILHSLYHNWQRWLLLVRLVWRNLFRHKQPRNLNSSPSRRHVGLMITSVVLLVITVSGVAFYQFILKDLPTPQELVRRKPALSTKIYDRNGVLLYKVYQNENRSILPLSEIPSHVIQATIAIEDAAFYEHPGFSVRGIIRAFRKNTTSDSLQGGSTITQQLVKNTLLTPERTITRKVKELILSILVEYYFTKDEILSMYLNEVGYGGTAYGIEEAAQQYFGKSVRDVSLAEAALLAGLPQSPTAYSPFGTSPELSVARQHHVLQRMLEEGMITTEEVQTARSATLVFASPKIDILAPHFVMFVRDQLAKEYGEEAVTHHGLEVITTLDSRIQQLAEAAVADELKRLKNLNVTNGAALVVKPQTGEILAMVGSVNYFDTTADGQVNVTLRPRQPGSSVKPLTYALALSERVITPATLIADQPIVYASPGSPPYAPKNYDGRFHGNVTVRNSLANSYNIPAVKTLAQVGVSNMVNFATSLGITTWPNPQRFGLALTLGAGEVRMIDLAQAYSVFAANGEKVPFTPLIKVTDPLHGLNKYYDLEGVQVLDEGVAFQISHMLADNQARSAAFGPNSVLNIPNHQVAVKTGTTNDLRDNWTFGYTHDYLVATWVGNNNNSQMSRVASGITGASPIWQTIMKGLLEDQSPHTFPVPSTVIAAPLCTSFAPHLCGGCDESKIEYYLPGTEPTSHCTPQADNAPEATTTPRDRLLEGTRTDKKTDKRPERPDRRTRNR